METPNTISKQKVRVVTIGGGTGMSSVLGALRKLQDMYSISAIITSMDSGGSAIVERTVYGVSPMSDLRKALLALASTETYQDYLLTKIVGYRLDGRAGERLDAMSLGNLMLIALEEILGSREGALNGMMRLLETAGEVIPVSLHTSNIRVEYDDGFVVTEEAQLDLVSKNFMERSDVKIRKVSLENQVPANPHAIDVIEQAEVIIFPPGDPIGSIIVNLLVPRVRSAIHASKAKLIWFPNIMSKLGQTPSPNTLKGHCNLLETYLPREVDVIVYNTGIVPVDVLDKYHNEERAELVINDMHSDPRVVTADLFWDQLYPSGSTEPTIRHDPDKIVRVFPNIVSQLFL